MVEYITKELENFNEDDKAMYIAINKIMMEWNPIDFYFIPEKDYEFTSLDIFQILKKTNDINKLDEYFDSEYFEINAIEPEKQALFNQYKEKIRLLVL